MLACAQLSIAEAQEWPDRPVRILVGFGAGGGTDIVTRIVADKLSETLGQQFVVENRTGAGGTIAGGVVARAPNDGYTALALSPGHTVSAVMVKQVPYHPVNDFAAVGIVALSAYVVAVPKDSPATDLKSLVEHINKEPDKLNYSTVGVGSTQHLIAESIRQRTGMKARPLAFRTSAEVATALLRGDAAFTVEPYQTIRGQVEAGDLRPIAVSTHERWPAIPSVQTLAESGFPGFGYAGWTGFVFPAGTPQPIIDKMHKALQQVLASEEVRKKIEDAGSIPSLSTAAEFKRQIELDIESFQRVAKNAGLEAK
jgi:tripartite-type tricarboxylate transporter receptor subunit TctC